MYTENDKKASYENAFAFDSVLKEYDGKNITFGDKKTFKAKEGPGNVVIISRIEGRNGPVFVSVSTIDRWIGDQMVKRGDEFLLPEGKSVQIVNGGRLALVEAKA